MNFIIFFTTKYCLLLPPSGIRKQPAIPSEKGAYSLIPLSWSEAEKKLTIGERQGSYPGMAAERMFRIVCGGWETKVSYDGSRTTSSYLPR